MTTVTENVFGYYMDENTKGTVPIYLYTLKNTQGMTVEVMNYGATVIAIKVPDKYGTFNDVLLGYNNLEDYIKPGKPLFGTTIGRCVGRLRNARYTFKGTEVRVTNNVGSHHDDGGLCGFHRVVWEPLTMENKLVLSYYSADGEEGFPGDVVIFAKFELTKRNTLIIDYTAKTTKPTYINIATNLFFNLAGHDAGPANMLRHLFGINAVSTVAEDRDGAPSGDFVPIEGSELDFSNFENLRSLETALSGPVGDFGFDNVYCVKDAAPNKNLLVARACHRDNGTVLDVFSNQPGVHFSHANELPVFPLFWKGRPDDLQTLQGKKSDREPFNFKPYSEYYRDGAFTLIPQNWPDAPNHAHFPNGILKPGNTYRNRSFYRFRVVKNLTDCSLIPMDQLWFIGVISNGGHLSGYPLGTLPPIGIDSNEPKPGEL